MTQRLGSTPGLYPSVTLGDGRWERVLRALRYTGAKEDAAIATTIDAQLQEVRSRNRFRSREEPLSLPHSHVVSENFCNECDG